MPKTNFPPALTETEDELRSPRKRKAILRAAAQTFLQKGYLGTSVDEVANIAGVSKQTVYKHFADKESLFTHLIVLLVTSAADLVQADMRKFDYEGDIETNLVELAVRQLTLVLRPPILQLRRLVIGEVSRFPALAKTFYEDGPLRTIESLSDLFANISKRGCVKIDNPHVAAAQFNWIIMSGPLNQAVFLGDDLIPNAEDLRRNAEQGVRMFLAAYG